MRPFDYFRILQRRWWIPVLGLLVGLLLAFVTQPSEQSVLVKTAPRIQYRAQHLLIADPTGTSRTGQVRVGFDRLALLTIAGPVRTAALRDLKAKGWPTVIDKSATDEESSGSGDKKANNAKKKSSENLGLPAFRNGEGKLTIYGPQGLVTVAPVPDPPTGALAIVATGGTKSAPDAANAFASELLKYLDTLNKQNYAKTTVRLNTDLQVAKYQAQNVEAQIAAAAANNPALLPTLQARRGDVQRNIDDVNQQILAHQVAGPDERAVTTLESASSGQLTVIRAPGGSTLSASQRLVAGGGIGFLGGLVLLIALELLGARIRDVAGTEGAARMPVIAEIPVVKMNRAERFVVATATDPASLTAEAYRSLRTSLLAMWQRHPKNVALEALVATDGATMTTATKGRPLRSLLVTSPGPAEGKSITVVNLAAAFAETGMTVIIVDADFRRPTQYRYLDRPRSPNLGDLDIACTTGDLDAVLQDTDVPGVRLAASAPNKADPGHSIAVAKSAARVGQELADIVIIDSPPLLLANDASDIALGVDASILLARSGWTRRSGITASADLMRRLEAPVIGVVIVGAEHGVRAGYYGYYGYYGYGYGYAQPGEVSLVSKLLPWKSGKRSEGTRSPSGAGATRPGSSGAVPGDRSAGSTGVDDPWA
jgi:capsular exopolysaccharide synthesis family protein